MATRDEVYFPSEGDPLGLRSIFDKYREQEQQLFVALSALSEFPEAQVRNALYDGAIAIAAVHGQKHYALGRVCRRVMDYVNLNRQQRAKLQEKHG